MNESVIAIVGQTAHRGQGLLVKWHGVLSRVIGWELVLQGSTLPWMTCWGKSLQNEAVWFYVLDFSV